MAESSRLTAENTAKYTKGSYITINFNDFMNDNPTIEDNRTGEEIAEEVISKLGLKRKNNECI